MRERERERGVKNVDGGKLSGDGEKESTQRCGTSWRCSLGGRGAMGEENQMLSESRSSPAPAATLRGEVVALALCHILVAASLAGGGCRL